MTRNKVDWTKPIQTVGGLPARVVCTDMKGHYPILVLVEKGGVESTGLRTLEGRIYDNSFGDRDIINVPPRKMVHYLNVYRGGLALGIHPNREKADLSAAPGRVACVRVEHTEGQYDD